MKSPLKNHPQTFALIALLAGSGNLYAVNAWNYQQETDRLSNQTYSFASSPLPRRDLYDDIRLEIVCKDKQLRVNINTESLIASQGRAFDFSYQIDQNTPVPLQMKTFPDSKRKGYTEDHAQRIIDDILMGKETIFVRVTTMTRKVLSGAISLEGATKPIQQVLEDCRIDPADPAKAENAGDTAYDLKAFEEGFNRLPAEQQKQVLSQIKKLMTEMEGKQ